MHTDVSLRKAKNSAENLIDGADGGAIHPVVARIFSGNRSSPLTREARAWCGARGGCDFATVVVMAVLGATGGASSSPTKSERDSAETLIDGADGEQSPP